MSTQKRQTHVYALMFAAGTLAWESLASVAHAEPAPPEGAAAIEEKWQVIQNAGSDASSPLHLIHAAQYCAGALTEAQATPDGVGAYRMYANVNTGTRGCGIYWSPGTGAQAIWGSIFDKWSEDGWETNDGYPTMDTDYTGAFTLYQFFTRLDGNHQPHESLETAIYDSGLGAWAIRGPRTEPWGTPTEPVLNSWKSTHFEHGYGYPANDSRPNNTIGTTCFPRIGVGCTNDRFNRLQEFKKWDSNLSRWRTTCACMSGGFIEWIPMND